MKTNLRRFLLSLISVSLFWATSACAESSTDEQDLERMQVKAISLWARACAIYPAMTDYDACADVVARRILSDRGAKPAEINQIIADQARDALQKHPLEPSERDLPPSQLAMRTQVYKIIDVISAACAISPAVTNQTECMDKAYHSILSSRDPHSTYFNAEELKEFRDQNNGNLEGIGVEINYLEDKTIGVMRVMEGSPAEKAGIIDGDRIVAVTNGKERLTIPSFPSLNAAIKKIKGEPGSVVTLEILRGENDTPVTVRATRARIKVPAVKWEVVSLPSDPNNVNSPKKKYGYIRLTQFGKDLRKNMVAAIKNIQRSQPDVVGFAFDVRGNPGGLLDEVYEAVDAIADSPEALVSVRDNRGVRALGTGPNDPQPEPQPGDVLNGLPCAVLVNRGSASASEVFAGSVKELERCAIVGKPTWAKGTVQQVSSNGDDGTGRKTTIEEYVIGSPTKWVAVQCVGVKPDIDYEIAGVIQPKKEMHECDLPGAVASGGVASDPSLLQKPPLEVRKPELYAFGLEARDVAKQVDKKAEARFERLKKLLKIKEKAADADEKKEEEKK